MVPPVIRDARYAEDREAIEVVIDAAGLPGGEPPLSEEPLWDLRHGARPEGLVAESDGGVAGYAHVMERRGSAVVEIAVPAAHRAEVLAPLVSAVADRPGVRLWARDEATAQAAEAAGMSVGRVLLRLECRLPVTVAAEEPEGIRIAPFRRGSDEGAYLLVSNEAYAGHPDSAGWDRDELERRMSRAWFDPGGVFLAWEEGRPVGLCWMKLHLDRFGEIYSIAVRPGAGGRGLGRALAVRGLRHASDRGAGRGLLYADAANRRAVEIYRGLGFTEAGRSLEFTR
jgi:mycothiol synthase